VPVRVDISSLLDRVHSLSHFPRTRRVGWSDRRVEFQWGGFQSTRFTVPERGSFHRAGPTARSADNVLVDVKGQGPGA
jgi:hypothetical protein